MSLPLLRKALPEKLLCAVKLEGEAGFFAAGAGFVDGPGFGSLVEGGGDFQERLGGVVFFTSAEELQIVFFQRMQPRVDAMVMELFAGAVAHPAFSGLRIGHKMVRLTINSEPVTVSERGAMSTAC